MLHSRDSHQHALFSSLWLHSPDRCAGTEGAGQNTVFFGGEIFFVISAWKTKTSWALIADRAIYPGLMRSMAKRAGSTTVEVEASHAVFMSQPQVVADLIAKVAKAPAK